MTLGGLERKLKIKKEKPENDDASYIRFKKIITGLIIFFGFITVVAGIVLYLVLFSGGSHNVDLSLAIPDTITSGVPFDLTATVSNRQDVLIGDANIDLLLPSNFVYLGVATGEGGSAATEKLGDVAAGSFTKHSFKILPVGAKGDSQKISVRVSYTSGRNSRYQLEEKQVVSVQNSPVSVVIKTPDNVIRGSSFEFTISYTNTTQFDFPDIAFQANYPATFHYDSASIPPDAMNNYWRLGGLKKGETGTIAIKGSYTGPERGTLEIPISFYAQFSGNDYEIDKETLAVTTAPSPVRLSILANNRETYIARAGETITFTIHYENNSGVALSNVAIKANIDGAMVNNESLDTDARINNSTHWLTWDSRIIPRFALLDAGAQGDLTATVHLKNFFPIRAFNDKNFVVRVSAQLDSPTVPYYVSAPRTTSAMISDFKVAGLTTLTSQLFFRDASAIPPNEGELPPRVGKPIEYTAHWLVRDFSTDARAVTVRAKLMEGVQFAGALQNSLGDAVSFNEETGEVVWYIDKISATKGVLGSPAEAVFRVRATPNTSLVGQFMPILGTSYLAATDDFTGESLTARSAEITTALPDDKTVSADDGIVIP